MVIVENGSAVLRIAHGNGVSPPVTLEPGSFSSIPSGVHARLRSADRNPVSIVIYFVTRIGASDVPMSVGGIDGAASGAVKTVLWNGPNYWSESATVHKLARIVIPAGEMLELTRAPDIDLLIGANALGIEVVSAGGSVVMLGEDRWPEISEGVAQIDADHAALINEDGVVLLRNVSDAPVSLVLISIGKAPISKSPFLRD